VNWRQKGETLAARFGMDDNKVARRRDFIRLDEDDATCD
jgi:hypothetical protein